MAGFGQAGLGTDYYQQLSINPDGPYGYSGHSNSPFAPFSSGNAAGSSYPPTSMPHGASSLQNFHSAQHAEKKAMIGDIDLSCTVEEQLHKFVGLAAGMTSIVAEHVLSHPCIVLRRTCQVHNISQRSHIHPFRLFQTIYNLQSRQSVLALWKGLGSSLMVKGAVVGVETALGEFTMLPREATRHCTMSQLSQHLLLKGIALVAVSPFIAASIVETVQSEVASDRPGVFDVIHEGLARLTFHSQPTTARVMSALALAPSFVTLGLLHYGISSLAQYSVLVSLKKENKNSTSPSDLTLEKSLFETYYPELVATFTGNLLADTLLYPLETIIHRLCVQGTRCIIDNTDSGLGVTPVISHYTGVWDCLCSILSQEGITGLYKGFGALLLQYGLHVVILRATRFVFDRLNEEAQKRKPTTSAENMAPYRPHPLMHPSLTNL